MLQKWDSFNTCGRERTILTQKLNFWTLGLDGTNLLFFGIPLVFGETCDLCEAKVREIIYRDMKKCQPVQIDRAQRVGSAILVQLQSFKQREVLIEPQQRAESWESARMYVRVDLSERVWRKPSGWMTPLLKQLCDDRRAKLQHDKLVLGSTPHTWCQQTARTLTNWQLHGTTPHTWCQHTARTLTNWQLHGTTLHTYVNRDKQPWHWSTDNYTAQQYTLMLTVTNSPGIGQPTTTRHNTTHLC